MKDDLKEYVLKWLEKAGNDYISGKRLFEIEPFILDYACFHFQQAVEKYLKAFLIYKNVEVEKTHDLNLLLFKVYDLDQSFEKIDLRRLNLYSVRVRYPDENIIPELEEVKYYQQLVEKIQKNIHNRINFQLEN